MQSRPVMPLSRHDMNRIFFKTIHPFNHIFSCYLMKHAFIIPPGVFQFYYTI